MERTIILENNIYPYTIHYKKMKSIIIKVVKGQIEVSCSQYTTIATIESLLIKHQQSLIRKINEYEPYISIENQYVYLFGIKYPLIMRDLAKKKCVWHDEGLYVYTTSVSQAIDQFSKQLLYEYVEKRTKDYLKKYFHHEMPTITIKKYKGRWGSCYYTQNKISFNLSLIHLNKELIDYVIMHELCHFIEANHSKKFYYEMKIRMPDYKMRQNKLKEKHV